MDWKIWLFVEGFGICEQSVIRFFFFLSEFVDV